MWKKTDRKKWMSKAEADLKGKIDVSELKYKVGEDFEISPFITADEIEYQKPIVGPKTKAGACIIANTCKEANEKALTMLEFGAEVLWIKLPKLDDVNELFENIWLNMIEIVLDIPASDNNSDLLKSYLASYYANKNTNVSFLDTYDQGVLHFSQSFTERINDATNRISKNHNAKNNKSLILLLELKPDFLTQIAELRAIRLISEKYEMQDNISIFSYISFEAFHDAEVHSIIIANYLLMSAYFGMTDVAFGIPFGDDKELSRLSLNIQNIFKEESKLNIVNDPTAGAYMIEKITEELILSVDF